MEYQFSGTRGSNWLALANASKNARELFSIYGIREQKEAKR